MYLPNVPSLRKMVSEMETEEIGVNFAFREPLDQEEEADRRRALSESKQVSNET